MRGCLGFVIFVLIAGPLLVTFEATAAVSTWLFNRDFYKSVLSTPEIYIAMIGPFTGFKGELLLDYLEDTPYYDEFITIVQSKEWATNVDSFVDQVFEVLDGQRNTVTFSIPTAPLRSLLTDERTNASFLSFYVSNLPTCIAGQDEFASSMFEGGRAPLPVCIPQGADQGQFLTQLVLRRDTLAENIPAQVTLTTPEIDIAPSTIPISSVEETLQIAVLLTGIFAVVFWLLSGLVGASGVRGRLVWLGATLMLASFTVLGIGFAVGSEVIPWIQNELSNAAIPPTDVSAQGIQLAFNDALTRAVSQIGASFRWVGMIPVVIAAALCVIGIFARQKPRDFATDSVQGDGPQEFEVFKPKRGEKPKRGKPKRALDESDVDDTGGDLIKPF